MEECLMYCVDTDALVVELAKKRWKSSDLAKKAGVTRETVNNLFKGQLPTYATIRKVAEALRLSQQQCGEIFFKQKLA